MENISSKSQIKKNNIILLLIIILLVLFLAGGTFAYFADDVILATDEYKEYYIIVWINETNTEQPLEPSKSFFAQVVFNSSNGTGVTSTFTA